MPRTSIVVLLATLLAPLATAQDLSIPRSFYGFGDPTALAVNAAETRAYVGEGAAISILDLAVLANPMPAGAVLARIPVDASVVALTLDETNQRLLVAGGSFGLLDIGLGGASFPVTVRDDPGDKVCFEIALTPSHVLAVFGAMNSSELRIYDRTTLAFVSTRALGTGTAFAVAVEGSFAYVAMGIGGLARVDISVPAAPVLQPGPVFPLGVFGEPARARDVAIAGARIYAAVDGYGLVSARTTVPWGPAMAVVVTPLTGPAAGSGTATLYAHHVAALGTTIAVGANVVAGREADGGPFTSYGPMNYSLAVGGVVTPAPLAAMDALFLFQQGATGLVQLQREDFAGAWRELILRPLRLWEVHLGLGFVARTTSVPMSLLATYRPIGNAPAEALVSLRDPDIILSGQDSAGTLYAGLLDIGNPDAIAPVPGTASNPGLGLWFDAHWPDASPTREWFVGNGNDTWRLHRFDTSQPAAGNFWEVPSPDDPAPGFNNGRNYFLSWLDGDLLLLTRAGTRWGLVGYSRSALVAEAGTRPPGSTLTTPPLWQLETHFLGELDQAQTWRCRTFSLPSGQRIAAIAAGFHTQPGPNASRPQIVLYDISVTTAPPTLLSVVLGPNLAGNAMAVTTTLIGTTTYLFVADFGYGVHVFDVSNPIAPVLVGGWACGPNVFDGWIDHPSDLELDRDALTGTLSAYVTVWRRGLLRLDVTNPASFNLPVLAERDTPGLPYGIAIRNAHGARGIVLADHQAGLRLYGEYSSWTPYGSGCPGSNGVPSLQLVSLPALGSTFSLGVQNLGSGIVLMATGFGQLSLPLLPLGLGFGAGCTLLVTPDALDLLPAAGGSATWSLAIPNVPTFVGMHIYNQAAEFGPVSAVSNAGDGKID